MYQGYDIGKNCKDHCTPTVFPLGMHPKIWLHTVVTWQRPQTLNLKVIAEKGGKIVFLSLSQIRI